MASAGAFDETQGALLNESAHGLARGRSGETNAAGEPQNGKAERELPLEAAVAQEMIIDHALDEIEAEARHEIIFDLFADEESIEVFGFHVGDPERGLKELKSRRAKSSSTDA
jgi:hypothetical protein